MDCIVNDQYRYIMFYSAKVGCTSLRTLFLAVHQDEMTDEQKAQLNKYHNLNQVFEYQPGKDYSDYYKFTISRNPYARLVSAFLDQYCYARNDGVQRMFDEVPPQTEPDNLVEFLHYLKTVPDAQRDTHFQTQSFYGHVEKVLPRRPWWRRMRPGELALNYHGDLAGYNGHMRKIFSKIFRRNKQMREHALGQISQVRKMNSVLYGDERIANASTLGVAELEAMVLAPKVQDFFESSETRALVEEIYADDFELFGYRPGDIPQKRGRSPELDAVPDDFNWQTYLLLSHDLEPAGIVSERRVLRHYLEFGQNEPDTRFYKIEAPAGFDWQRYLQRNEDLQVAGVDNERDAIIHYLRFGLLEGRPI